MADPGRARDRVLSFLRAHPTPLALLEDADGQGARLLESGSGKSLHLRWGEISVVEERSSSQRAEPYLALALEDGRALALADVGFAFAPDPRNSGDLPELPATFCFRDFATLTEGALRLLEQQGREGEAARAFLVAIALVDGARAAGFDVSAEERILEGLLREMEDRGGLAR